MKNRILKLLTLTMLIGTLLVGCGGKETSIEANNGNSTSASTEANFSDNIAKIDKDIEYTETAIAFLIANESDIDKSMVDGTDVPNTTRENVEYMVRVNASVDLYNKGKEKIGYLKDGMTIAYVQIDNEWCIAASTDYTEFYYALAADIVPVVEIVEESASETVNNGKESSEVSTEEPLEYTEAEMYEYILNMILTETDYTLDESVSAENCDEVVENFSMEVNDREYNIAALIRYLKDSWPKSFNMVSNGIDENGVYSLTLYLKK